MSHTRRLAVHPILSAVWTLVTVGWISALALEATLSSNALCELAPGSSLYGQADWQLARLGTVCVYSLQQPEATLVEGPHLRWLVTGLLLLWGLSLLGRRRATRSTSTAVAGGQHLLTAPWAAG